MFSIDNQSPSASSVSSKLEGNKIHTVTFKGAEAITVGNETKYEVLSLKFENDQGEFVETFFPPDAKTGGSRKPNSFGGENPSEVEELTAKVRHYIAGLNPDLSKQIEAGTKTLAAKNWNEFRALVVKALAKGVGTETQIKLLKNGKGMAQTPGFVLSISKTGSLYMRTNFIGNNLSFTTKELEKISTISTAKPTIMDSSLPDVGSSEINLDDLDDLDL